MKKFIAALCFLTIIVGFIAIHSYVVLKLTKNIDKLSQQAETQLDKEDWRGLETTLIEIKNNWDKKRLWSSMTIETDELEQIEISLEQSQKYAKEQSKADFIGEFVMFSELVTHLPHHEGFSIEEIL